MPFSMRRIAEFHPGRLKFVSKKPSSCRKYGLVNPFSLAYCSSIIRCYIIAAKFKIHCWLDIEPCAAIKRKHPTAIGRLLRLFLPVRDNAVADLLAAVIVPAGKHKYPVFRIVSITLSGLNQKSATPRIKKEGRLLMFLWMLCKLLSQINNIYILISNGFLYNKG